MNSLTVLTVPAYAKLNFSLDIVGRRDDGYHDIVSEMQAIDLCDDVTVEVDTSCEGIAVTCDNPAVPVGSGNIAWRAAEMFLRETRLTGLVGVKIDIKKRIPLMAGLGGSSTDGAAVLRALNILCQLYCEPLPESQLLDIGAALGADVPFCLTGGRALCEGIGERITLLPDLPPQYYVIVQPEFRLCTKRAYELYDESPERFSGNGNVFQRLYNDPRIEAICAELLQLGAESAAMTGSGSAVFGVFSERAAAESALGELDYPFKTIASNVIKEVLA